MRRLNQKFLILILLSQFACTDIVHIQIPLGQTSLSVDAVLTNRGLGDTVKLSNTLAYFSDSTFSPYKGAKVILTDSSGSTENLTEISPGIFPIRKTQAQLGHTYYLDIYTSNDHFRASTHIKRLSPTLDSVHAQYHTKSPQYDSSGYYLYLYGQELPGLGDNAWIRVYRNQVPLSSASDLFVINDDFTDGKYYSGVSIRTHEAFKNNDIARVEIWSITKDAYNYLDQIQTQINNRGIFQTTPANVPTNFLSTQTGISTQVTGYFIGSLVESISQPIYILK
jgi:hypothetical protein